MSIGSLGKTSVGTILLAVVAAVLLSIPAMADSQARIVRLSDVQGDVQIDRNIGQGYQKAFLNMPIIEGARLWAKDDGRAEIEFEDGSVLHIVPNTKVNFEQLSLQGSGGKVSTINLENGTLYLTCNAKSADDKFTVNFAGESTTVTQPAHFRVDLNDTAAELAVFKGDVEVSGPSGSVQLSKNHSASFDLLNDDKYSVAKNYEQDPYDQWDKAQNQYHDRYYSSNANSGSIPYGYGVSDLNYYGNYTMVPGYGYMWQPYFANMGWDPFSNGAWMWYPGSGYTWVSSYPWGWMPYRYGTWQFVPSYGWMWQPGGWNTWNSGLAVANPPQRFIPPQPPNVPGHQTVVVGRPPVSTANAPRRMTITAGSAGLGVPRGGVNNLPKVAMRAGQEGSVNVHTAAPTRAVFAPFESGFGARPTTSTGVRTGAPTAPSRATSGTHMPSSAGAHVGGAPSRSSGGTTPHK